VSKDLLHRINRRLEPPEQLLDLLSAPALEALSRLIEADGDIVPLSQLCHTTTRGSTRSAGSWASEGRAASVVCHIRQVLGKDAVLTVHGKGYAIGVLPKDL
jgi:hypothetical protein